MATNPLRDLDMDEELTFTFKRQEAMPFLMALHKWRCNRERFVRDANLEGVVVTMESMRARVHTQEDMWAIEEALSLRALYDRAGDVVGALTFETFRKGKSTA